MWTFTIYEVMMHYNEFPNLTKCCLVHQEELDPILSIKLVQIESPSCVLVEDSRQGFDIVTSHPCNLDIALSVANTRLCYMLGCRLLSQCLKQIRQLRILQFLKLREGQMLWGRLHLLHLLKHKGMSSNVKAHIRSKYISKHKAQTCLRKQLVTRILKYTYHNLTKLKDESNPAMLPMLP